MATHTEQAASEQLPEDMGSTVIELARYPDGTWEATQPGLDVVGTGDSAARATEHLAGRIADLVEAGDL